MNAISRDEVVRPRTRPSPGRTILGWILLAGGALGLLLPVLPGIPLLLAGLIILSGSYQWARRSLDWLKQLSRKSDATSVEQRRKCNEGNTRT